MNRSILPQSFSLLAVVSLTATLLLCSCAIPTSLPDTPPPLKKVEGRCAIRIQRLARLEACEAHVGVWCITEKESHFVLLNDGAAHDLSVLPGLLKVIPEWGETLYFNAQAGAAISLEFKARIAVKRTEPTLAIVEGSEWRTKPELGIQTLAIRNHTRLPEKELQRILKLSPTLPASWRLVEGKPAFELHLEEDRLHLRCRLLDLSDGREVWRTAVQKEPERADLFLSMPSASIPIPGTYIVARDVDELTLDAGLATLPLDRALNYYTGFTAVGRLLASLPETDKSGQFLPLIWRNRRFLGCEYTLDGFFARFEGGLRMPIVNPFSKRNTSSSEVPHEKTIAEAWAISGKRVRFEYLRVYHMDLGSLSKHTFTTDAFMIEGPYVGQAVCVYPGMSGRELMERLDKVLIEYIMTKDHMILVGSLGIHFTPGGEVSRFSINSKGLAETWKNPKQVFHLVEP